MSTPAAITDAQDTLAELVRTVRELYSQQCEFCSEYIANLPPCRRCNHTAHTIHTSEASALHLCESQYRTLLNTREVAYVSDGQRCLAYQAVQLLVGIPICLHACSGAQE